jgi:hypothetical protein
MKPEELSKLTPLQLLRYNSPLPHDDPENPYVHADYPKFLYQVTADYRLVSALVNNEGEESQLEGDWRESILDWGIITHPAVEKFQTGSAINLRLTPEQIDQVTAAKPAAEPAKKKNGNGKPTQRELEQQLTAHAAELNAATK